MLWRCYRLEVYHQRPAFQRAATQGEAATAAMKPICKMIFYHAIAPASVYLTLAWAMLTSIITALMFLGLYFRSLRLGLLPSADYVISAAILHDVKRGGFVWNSLHALTFGYVASNTSYLLGALGIILYKDAAVYAANLMQDIRDSSAAHGLNVVYWYLLIVALWSLTGVHLSLAPLMAQTQLRYDRALFSWWSWMSLWTLLGLLGTVYRVVTEASADDGLTLSGVSRMTSNALFSLLNCYLLVGELQRLRRHADVRLAPFPKLFKPRANPV